jgi:hypothetical protein
MKRFAIFAAAAALLAAGAPALAQPDPVVTAAQGYELRLMGGGLASGRRGLHSYPVFVFGISRTEALSRVAALRGRASATGIGRNCGRVPLNFARFGPLTLWFRSNRWVGWSLTGPRGRRPLESEFDLGIGTERRNIGDADRDQPVFPSASAPSGGTSAMRTGTSPSSARPGAAWSSRRTACRAC